MRRLGLVSLAVLLLLGAHLAISQQDFSKVEFKTVHVAGNVHMLDSGVAGNIGLSAERWIETIYASLGAQPAASKAAL